MIFLIFGAQEDEVDIIEELFLIEEDVDGFDIIFFYKVDYVLGDNPFRKENIIVIFFFDF